MPLAAAAPPPRRSAAAAAAPSARAWLAAQLRLRALSDITRRAAEGVRPAPPRAAAEGVADATPSSVPWLRPRAPSGCEPDADLEPDRAVAPPAPAPAHELLGFSARLAPRRGRGRRPAAAAAPLGVVARVLALGTTDAPHPLLVVVTEGGTEGGGGGGGGQTDALREEHLIPFARPIIARVDRAARVVYLDPPPGLLDLGRRAARLARLRAELGAFIAASAGGGEDNHSADSAAAAAPSALESDDSEGGATSRRQLAPRMPTRAALRAAGRADLAAAVAAAGGFAEVAAALGLRAARRPPGYWDDAEALDRELSLFVAAHWVQFDMEEGEAGEADEEEEGGLKGGAEARLEGESGGEEDDAGDERGGSDYESESESGSEYESEAEEEEEEGFGGGATPEEEAFPRAGALVAALEAPTRARRARRAAAARPAAYWYNQVTRRVALERPPPPTAVPLDDEGSVLLTEAEADRAMPSRGAVAAAGRYDLHAAVVAAGGYRVVASALRRRPAWPPSAPLRRGRALAAALRGAAAEAGRPRGEMPTAGELLAAGRGDALAAVLRRGGFAAVAAALGWRAARRCRGAGPPDLAATVAAVAAYLEEEGRNREVSDCSASASGAGAGAAAAPAPARLPTHEELRRAGRHGLRRALQAHGSRRVAAAMGLGVDARGGRGGGRPPGGAAAGGQGGEESSGS
jgi:hypothetical protein